MAAKVAVGWEAAATAGVATAGAATAGAVRVVGWVTTASS